MVDKDSDLFVFEDEEQEPKPQVGGFLKKGYVNTPGLGDVPADFVIDEQEDIRLAKKRVFTILVPAKTGNKHAMSLLDWCTVVKKRNQYHQVNAIVSLRFPLRSPPPIEHSDMVRYLAAGYAAARAVFMSYDVKDLAQYGYLPASTAFPRTLKGSELHAPSQAFLQEIAWRNSGQYQSTPVDHIAPGYSQLVYINKDGTVTCEETATIRRDEDWVYCINPIKLWFTHQMDQVRRPIPYTSDKIMNSKYRAQAYLNKVIKEIEEINPRAFSDNKYVAGFDASEEILLRSICKDKGLNFEYIKEKIMKGDLKFEEFVFSAKKEKATHQRTDLDAFVL